MARRPDWRTPSPSSPLPGLPFHCWQTRGGAAQGLAGPGCRGCSAGAGVEGFGRFNRFPGGKRREVGDPAEVKQPPAAGGMAEEDVLCEGNERRALPAGNTVGAAEIADDLRLDLSCEQRGIDPLNGI